MSESAIECHKLLKSYGQNRVLDEIDLRVDAGSFYALVGVNGCGKSTMIKAILDLVAIDRGSIELFGISHRQVSSRNQVAYLPDRFSPPAYLRCREYFQYMLELYANKQSSRQIEEMLDMLALDRTIMDSSVRRLSKGMTQKLGIASCLLSGKKLLMLDEPMSGLDPRARASFKRQLFRLKQQGVTLFFSSHLLADVDELADRMAVLHRRQVCFEGTPGEFRQTYRGGDLEEAYIHCIDKIDRSPL